MAEQTATAAARPYLSTLDDADLCIVSTPSTPTFDLNWCVFAWAWCARDESDEDDDALSMFSTSLSAWDCFISAIYLFYFSFFHEQILKSIVYYVWIWTLTRQFFNVDDLPVRIGYVVVEQLLDSFANVHVGLVRKHIVADDHRRTALVFRLVHAHVNVYSIRRLIGLFYGRCVVSLI